MTSAESPFSTPPTPDRPEFRTPPLTSEEKERARRVELGPEETHEAVKAAFDGMPLPGGAELKVGRRQPGKSAFSHEDNKLFTPSEGPRPLLTPEDDGKTDEKPKKGALPTAVGSALTITRRVVRGTPTQRQTAAHRVVREPLVRTTVALAMGEHDGQPALVDELTSALTTAVADFTEMPPEDAAKYTTDLVERTRGMVHVALLLDGEGGEGDGQA